MTIFVDVDDTLILYKNSSDKIHPYGVINGDSFEPNEILIEQLKKFKGHIVVWSGGGKEYARQIVIMVLKPLNIRCMVASKFDDFNMIKVGDIVIDDQSEYYTGMKEAGVKIYKPKDLWYQELFSEVD